MKTKRLSFADLKKAHINKRTVLFHKIDKPSVDMGFIEAINDEGIMVKTLGGMSRVMWPMELYVFYGFEADNDED